MASQGPQKLPSRGHKAAAAASAKAAEAEPQQQLKAGARPSSERSPPQKQPADKQPRVEAGAAPKSLFPAPRVTPPTSAPQQRPHEQRGGDEVGDDNRVFSTPDGTAVTIPARFLASEDASFSYRVGHMEGRTGKEFAKAFNPALYVREAFFQGFADASAMLEVEKAQKLATPDLGEDRAGPVEKAELQTYVEKAKSGKLSALIRQHIFGDVVNIRAGNKVSFEFARPFFIRQGEEGELKAVTSYYLSAELGGAYDVGDFNDAWDSGCDVEVATKSRKADLAGVDKKRVKTTVKQVTLRAELRIMLNNARSALILKVWSVYREVNNLPSRPKGDQNTPGKKATKIDDPVWEVHAKEMQVAALKETSRYAAPFMEGKFSDNPDEDCSLDPVGLISAVRALVLIFKGKSIEEDKLRVQIHEQEQLPEFRMIELAIFNTVVTDKIKQIKRGATCPAGSFEDQVKATVKFYVKKFERFGWTDKPGSKPALTKFVKISDYPVSARPLLVDDDDAYWEDDDGLKVEKAVLLAGEVEEQEEDKTPAAGAPRGGGGGGGAAAAPGGDTEDEPAAAGGRQ